MNKHQRLETSSESTFIRTWGQSGSKDGQFNYPYGICVGCDGTIYVVDSMNDRIQCFDVNGKFISKWGQNGDGDGEFNVPRGLTIAFNETKNETNNITKSIMIAMHLVPQLALFPPGVLPICVAYIGIEYLYVTELNNNRVQVFEMDGSHNVRFIRKWGSYGSGDGQFNRPWSCAVSSRDVSGPGPQMIYVSDTYNHRIQVFDSNGKFVRKWGTRGNGLYQFYYPRGICLSYNYTHCFDHDVSIYISDQYNKRIVCYNSDGTLVRECTPQTDLLDEAYNLMVDDENCMVYVVDNWNNCIRKYRKDGSFVKSKSWNRYGCSDGQLSNPAGIARGVNPIDGRPIIYIADASNNRIVVINQF